MMTLLTETAQKLMSQYTFEMDADSLNKDLVCTICKKIMINAYETYCGCHYCRGCIVTFLAGEDKYCPGSKDECKDESLVLERNVAICPRLNKTILKAKVHCPNQPCPFITELTKIEDHLRVCIQQSMECPFFSVGCENEKASKEKILVHLHEEVLTHSQLFMEFIHILKNQVDGLKKDLALNKSDLSTLKEESKEKEEELKREMEEQRRSMIKQEKEMESQKKETNELKGEIKRLKGECERREMMMEDVKKEVAILKKEIVEVRERSRIIKNNMEMSERDSAKYRKEIRSTLNKMKEETDKKEEVPRGMSTATLIQSMKDVRERVDKLSETVAILNVGTNTKVAVGQSSFTVDKFSTRMASKEKILSPYFYSHTNGYKIRLWVYPGGEGVARGIHLSLYIRICKGEYDDMLPWPCRHTFTLSIANQRDGGTYANLTLNYATSADNLRDIFDKPIYEDNRGRGMHVSHNDLQSKVGLIVDDSVIVRCVVSAPP